MQYQDRTPYETAKDTIPQAAITDYMKCIVKEHMAIWTEPTLSEQRIQKSGAGIKCLK